MASSSSPTVSLQNAEFKTKFHESDSDYEIFETFKFDGVYAIKCGYVNPEIREALTREEGAVNNKAVYLLGNILYKMDEPKIWQYIDLIIQATYTVTKMLSVPVDASVKNSKQMVGGTICPTRDVLFLYDGKLFILYGRYIYGYNHPYVRFTRAQPRKPEFIDDEDEEITDEDEEITDEHEKDWPPLLTEDEILLPTINWEEKRRNTLPLQDHSYSFQIVEQSSETVLAFGLYR